MLRALTLLLLPATLAAQMPTAPPVPPPDGFRVYLITDMEGLASVVFNREIISGYEGERYRDQSSRDYWEHYRGILTPDERVSPQTHRTVNVG